MSSPTASRMLFEVAASVDTVEELSPGTCGLEQADEAVMQRVQSGEREALGVLFDRYSRLILSVGLRILKDLSEAQELVQDVFLYVHNKCESFDAKKSQFRSWLVQIAYCRAFDKRQYLISRRFYDHSDIDEVVESVKSHVSLENAAEMAELREIFERAFAELTERQRRTLELFFFQGFTLREISSQMDEPLSTTRHHYYRGLEKLRSLVNLAPAPSRDGHPNGR